MKKLLISAASTIFIFGSAFAREAPATSLSRQSIAVEHHTERITSARSDSGVICTTMYITTTKADGEVKTRKSVDCEE
jgi:hypothetical protein